MPLTGPSGRSRSFGRFLNRWKPPTQSNSMLLLSVSMSSNHLVVLFPQARARRTDSLLDTVSLIHRLAIMKKLTLPLSHYCHPSQVAYIIYGAAVLHNIAVSANY